MAQIGCLWGSWLKVIEDDWTKLVMNCREKFEDMDIGDRLFARPNFGYWIHNKDSGLSMVPLADVALHERLLTICTRIIIIYLNWNLFTKNYYGQTENQEMLGPYWNIMTKLQKEKCCKLIIFDENITSRQKTRKGISCIQGE